MPTAIHHASWIENRKACSRFVIPPVQSAGSLRLRRILSCALGSCRLGIELLAFLRLQNYVKFETAERPVLRAFSDFTPHNYLLHIMSDTSAK